MRRTKEIQPKRIEDEEWEDEELWGSWDDLKYPDDEYDPDWDTF